MILTVSQLCKRYGPDLPVLTEVSLSVRAGEICGIVGENGAGKSTFASILTHGCRPEAGSVQLHMRGKAHDLLRETGHVALVPQAPERVDLFDAVDNIYLGKEIRRFGLPIVDRGEEASMVAVWSELLFRTPSGLAHTWNDGEVHRVAVLRAFLASAPILIVDEVPAALDSRDRLRFLRFLRRFADAGRIVLLISHQLDEVVHHCDSAYAFHRGRAYRAEPLTSSRLLELVFPVSPQQQVVRSAVPGDFLLTLDGFPARRGLSIEEPVGVRKGEVTCFVGLSKNGQDELFEALSGLLPVKDWKLLLDGESVNGRDTKWRRKNGFAFIPADRRRQGLVDGLTCEENLLLGLGRGNAWKRPDGHIRAPDVLSDYNIKKRPSTLVETLSGGNQQKLMVARELLPGSAVRVLVAYNPAVGIDAGTRALILSKVRSVAERGGGVLLITTDPDEALAIGDRFFVLKSGEISEVLSWPTERARLLSLLS